MTVLEDRGRPGWWAEYFPVMEERVMEELDRSSCAPSCKAIATCAAGAWERGWTADQWHDDLLRRHHEDADLVQIAQAIECMRRSGLWLWNS